MDKLKTCTKCKKELPETIKYFYTLKHGRNGLKAQCKECSREYSRVRAKEYIQREGVKEQNNKRAKVWRKNNKKRCKELASNWRSKNIKRFKKYAKEYSIEKRKNLYDSYVTYCMRKNVKDLPKEIIEQKRLIIQLKRELKSNNVKIR